MQWPDREAVDAAVREWADALVREHPEVQGVAYVGSYARGDWGVGSDVDILVIASDAPKRREERGIGWASEHLLVPADLIVYTEDEWRALMVADTRWTRAIREEAVWVSSR